VDLAGKDGRNLIFYQVWFQMSPLCTFTLTTNDESKFSVCAFASPIHREGLRNYTLHLSFSTVTWSDAKYICLVSSQALSLAKKIWSCLQSHLTNIHTCRKTQKSCKFLSVYFLDLGAPFSILKMGCKRPWINRLNMFSFRWGYKCLFCWKTPFTNLYSLMASSFSSRSEAPSSNYLNVSHTIEQKSNFNSWGRFLWQICVVFSGWSLQ
jgi:hypothetical protein